MLMNDSNAQGFVLQQMFWSGVRDFVHRYSYGGRFYTTLEDTLTGETWTLKLQRTFTLHVYTDRVTTRYILCSVYFDTAKALIFQL